MTDTNAVKPYQIRVLVEQQELHARLRKLEKFMLTSEFTSLEAIDKSYLKIQAGAMANYSLILLFRIARFGGE